jgi:hypothetical protein
MNSPLHLKTATALLATLAFVIASDSGMAQAPKKLWVQRHVVKTHSQANSIAVDKEGNVAVTGIIYDQGLPDSDYDYFTAKYAADDGALLWQKRYDGPAHGDDWATKVAVDGFGNVVVTGWSYNESGNPDYYTAKYAAADGALLWERRYDDPGHGDDYAKDLTIDSAGNVIVTGSSDEMLEFPSNTDFYTVKYAAANGATLWEQRYDGPAHQWDEAKATAIDHLGDVVVTGRSLGKHGSYFDILTAKYHGADGRLLWVRRHDGISRYSGSEDDATSVGIDRAGNVMIAGVEDQGRTYYIAKYAALDGGLLWEKRRNGSSTNYMTQLAVDNADNVAVIAFSDYGPRNDFMARYAPNGTLLWERRSLGVRGSFDSALAVRMDDAGNVIAIGRSIVGYTSDGDTGNEDDPEAPIPVYAHYIAKYGAADGTLLWKKQCGYVDTMAVGRGFVVVTGGSATTKYLEKPTPQTLAADGIFATGAALQGTVNPNGSLANAAFEYGTDPGLAGAIITAPIAVGDSVAPVPVSASLGSLDPLVAYYFRVVAIANGETIRGDIQSFTTSARPRTLPLPTPTPRGPIPRPAYVR